MVVRHAKRCSDTGIPDTGIPDTGIPPPDTGIPRNSSGRTEPVEVAQQQVEFLVIHDDGAVISVGRWCRSIGRQFRQVVSVSG